MSMTNYGDDTKLTYRKPIHISDTYIKIYKLNLRRRNCWNCSNNAFEPIKSVGNETPKVWGETSQKSCIDSRRIKNEILQNIMHKVSVNAPYLAHITDNHAQFESALRASNEWSPSKTIKTANNFETIDPNIESLDLLSKNMWDTTRTKEENFEFIEQKLKEIISDIFKNRKLNIIRSNNALGIWNVLEDVKVDYCGNIIAEGVYSEWLIKYFNKKRYTTACSDIPISGKMAARYMFQWTNKWDLQLIEVDSEMNILNKTSDTKISSSKLPSPEHSYANKTSSICMVSSPVPQELSTVLSSYASSEDGDFDIEVDPNLDMSVRVTRIFRMISRLDQMLEENRGVRVSPIQEDIDKMYTKLNKEFSKSVVSIKQSEQLLASFVSLHKNQGVISDTSSKDATVRFLASLKEVASRFDGHHVNIIKELCRKRESMQLHGALGILFDQVELTLDNAYYGYRVVQQQKKDKLCKECRALKRKPLFSVRFSPPPSITQKGSVDSYGCLLVANSQGHAGYLNALSNVSLTTQHLMVRAQHSPLPMCFPVNCKPPPGYVYYFAYGTHMNLRRLETYLCRPIDLRLWAILFGFELRFNKIGMNRNGGRHPNIIHSPRQSVEGCLYRLKVEEVQLIDHYVGCPRHFVKVMLPIWFINSASPETFGVAQFCAPALTYTATDDWITQDITISAEMSLNEVLSSADIVTPAYKQRLGRVYCYNDSFC